MGRKINMLKHAVFNPYRKRLWSIKQNPPTILVATYIHEYKDYSFNAWTDRMLEIIQNYKSFVNKPVKIDLLVVDNSDGEKYFDSIKKRLRKKLDCIGIGSDIWVERVNGFRNTRKKQWASQKLIWEFSLKHHYDYLFLVESDVFPPAHALQELLKFNKRIISGVYSLKNKETYEAHKKFLEKEKELGKWSDEEIGDILCIIPYMPKRPIHRKRFNEMVERIERKQYGHCVRVFACGLGVILIKREVLRKAFPETTDKNFLDWLKKLRQVARGTALERKLNGLENYLINDLNNLIKSHQVILDSKIHPDTNFHVNCERLGIARFVDPYLDCFHWRSNWKDCPIDR